MRIDRAAHLPWAIFVAVATALASLFYAARFHPQRVPVGLRFYSEIPPDHATVGGTPLGLVLGALAFGIFIFAALLGARKKLPSLPLGNVQRWVRGHIWLTLLTIPLILLHCGFHLGGLMTSSLMLLYAIVMVSGIYGLILQHKLPRLMKERLPAEIVYEQIPNIRAQLCAAAERLQRSLRRDPVPVPNDTLPAFANELTLSVAPEISQHAVIKTPSAAEKGTLGENAPSTHPIALEDAPENAGSDFASEQLLSEFIARRLLPYLRARRGERFRLGNAREAGETFRHLKLGLAAPYRASVEEMQRWCDERRLLDLQTRFQHWLHGWLLVHVPLSFLLLLMTAWHAFVTLFRY